ncbi:MAG: hypothetical protein ACK5NT_11890 [Pyrinomonadaceae bacterium]
MITPNAKRSGVLIQEFIDEVLVYNLETDKVYCLNHSITAVFNSCNGVSNLDEIRALVSKELKTEVSTEFVLLSLNQLAESGLLEDSSEVVSFLTTSNLSRRELIRKAGLATMIALPVISLLVAPEASNAASCTSFGNYFSACNIPAGQCCTPPYNCSSATGPGTCTYV